MDPKELIFRHYTSSKFLSEYRPECVLERASANIFKPLGFWGSPSPINKNYSDFYTWKEWLIDNDYEEDDPTSFGSKYFFDFKIKEESKILSILNYEEDIKIYRKYCGTEYYKGGFFDKSLYEDFDGIFLYHGYDQFDIHMSLEFNGWDVDSIVVWNPEMIVTI